MANVFETRSTFTDFMKEVYQDYISVTTAEHSITMKELMRRAKNVDFGGKNVHFGVQYDSMGSVGTQAEGDILPQSLPVNIDVTTISCFWHYFTVAVSGQAMATSESQKDAYARAWAQQVSVKQKAFAQHMNRQMCGDGLAILCQMDGSINSQAMTVDNAYGLSGFNASNVNGAMFLTPNMYIQARTSGGTAHDAGLKISAIATKGAFPNTSAVLTLVGTASSTVDGDYLYTAASTTASTDSYGHEMLGIRSLIDDSTVAATIQGIDGTAYPEWQSQMGTGSTPGTAEALTTNRMMSLWTDIQIAGGKTDLIITSPAVWHTYGNLAYDKNQMMNAKVFDTAFPALEFNGVPVYMDSYCVDELFYIDNRALTLYQASPMGWLEDPDSGLIIKQRQGASASYDQFAASWKWYASLGITNRSWCGKMEDITVSVDKVLD